MSDLDEQKPSRRLWVLAAVGAVALHVGGGALAIGHLTADEPDEIVNLQGIEIGLVPMSLRAEESELPPGPDSNASAASPELAEQKAELKDANLPKDVPTEAEDADRAVTPNDTKKPVEEDTKVASVQTAASTVSVAAEATALQKSEAPEGPRSVRVIQKWHKELVAHLDRHKRYPAGRALKSAEIYVRFTLDRLGHVISTVIEKGSGDAAFDEAAIAMVKRSDPVPPPPPMVADEGLSFTLPVIFRVKGKS